MAILAFQKPDKVIMLEADEQYGKFEFRPLEPGYGITVGNALRRILLSSLEGFAITTVKINGIDHEFSTITGVMEDVTEIILNLKQIRLKRTIEDFDNEKIVASVRFYPRKRDHIVSVYQFAINENYRGQSLLKKMLSITGFKTFEILCPLNSKFNEYYKKTSWQLTKVDEKYNYRGLSLK